MTLRKGRRAPILVAFVISMLLGALGVTPSEAATEDDVARAREAVDRAQDASDELAARYEAAVARHAEVTNRQELTRSQIADAERRMRELQSVVENIAVTGYMSGQATVGPEAILDSDDVLNVRRRALLLDRATEPRNLSLAEFQALHDDLQRDRARLAQETAEANELLGTLESEAARLDAQLREAQAAQAELEERLAREEEEARRQADEQRRREAEAAERQLLDARRGAQQRSRSATTTPTTTPPSTAVREPEEPPAGASMVCPIQGALSFVDSWGAPRSGGRRHQGVDLMSPHGTPNVAVVSGEIRHKEGQLSGFGVYLYGDDGNSYWYFHLSAYEGPPRRVQQGEVVGYVGSTGNASASAPHTHFEYHPGGGSAANPYPLARAAC